MAVVDPSDLQIGAEIVAACRATISLHFFRGDQTVASCMDAARQVLVGRVELVTAEAKRAVEEALARRDCFYLCGNLPVGGLQITLSKG
jgi:hypothetical protein